MFSVVVLAEEIVVFRNTTRVTFRDTPVWEFRIIQNLSSSLLIGFQSGPIGHTLRTRVKG